MSDNVGPWICVGKVDIGTICFEKYDNTLKLNQTL